MSNRKFPKLLICLQGTSRRYSEFFPFRHKTATCNALLSNLNLSKWTKNFDFEAMVNKVHSKITKSIIDGAFQSCKAVRS